MRPAFSACLALVMTITPALAQQSESGPATPAPAPHAALDPKTAIYELRTYYPAPGKLAALNARFREHTLALFAKSGMHNVAYWNEMPTAEAPEGRIIYVLAYPSREAREAAWKTFVNDPEWHAVAAASEANGKLVAKVESVFMTMADYSPPLS